MEFSTRSIHEGIKAQGDKRVSEPSANYLGEILESYAIEVSEKALEIVEEDDRETVREEDIREALS